MHPALPVIQHEQPVVIIRNYHVILTVAIDIAHCESLGAIPCRIGERIILLQLLYLSVGVLHKHPELLPAAVSYDNIVLAVIVHIRDRYGFRTVVQSDRSLIASSPPDVFW